MRTHSFTIPKTLRRVITLPEHLKAAIGITPPFSGSAHKLIVIFAERSCCRDNCSEHPYKSVVRHLRHPLNLSNGATQLSSIPPSADQTEFVENRAGPC